MKVKEEFFFFCIFCIFFFFLSKIRNELNEQIENFLGKSLNGQMGKKPEGFP